MCAPTKIFFVLLINNAERCCQTKPPATDCNQKQLQPLHFSGPLPSILKQTNYPTEYVKDSQKFSPSAQDVLS